MRVRSRIITSLIFSSLAYAITSSPVWSDDYSEEEYREGLNRAVERNSERLRLQVDRELSPRRENAQIVGPAGQPSGYIQTDRWGDHQMYDQRNNWLGTVRGR